MIYRRHEKGPPVRTLAVLHVAEISGAALTLRGRLGWLSAQGEVELVVPGPGPATDLYAGFATVTELDYSALLLPRELRGAFDLAARARRDVAVLRRRIRAARPELVVVATAMLPAALLAARLERVPSLLHAAEILSGGRSRRRRLAGGALARIAGSLADVVAACSQEVADQYHFADVEVVYPPISDAFAGGDGRRFRRRHGIPVDAPLVLCAGSISEGRGQDILVDALDELRARHPEVHCAIVGVPFPRRADLDFERLLAQRAAAAGGVALCGFESQMPDAYAAADVVVNPASDPEAFGRVACEALVARRPVVATAVGAVREVLNDGHTALLVPPGDAAALAAAIGQLLSSPEQAERLVEAGRRDVLERFDPAVSLEAFKRLVERLPGREAGRGPAGPGAPLAWRGARGGNRG